MNQAISKIIAELVQELVMRNELRLMIIYGPLYEIKTTTSLAVTRLKYSIAREE